MATRFLRGDITDCEVEVIVNAANTELKHGGGVAKAIALKAGKVLIEESQKAGYVPIGDFYVTSAGNLKAQKVVHIPTIDYVRDAIISYEELGAVFEKVLKWMLENGYKRVATPLLGTGVVGLDKGKVQGILEAVAGKYPSIEVWLVDK